MPIYKVAKRSNRYQPYKSPKGNQGVTQMVGIPRTVLTTVAPLSTGGYFGASVRRRLRERKTVDVDPADYNITSTGSVTLLNGIATGTDFTNRIGRKIVMRSLNIRGFVYPEDTTTNTCTVRMIWVYDQQTNAAQPAVTDILKSADPTSQLNLDNRDRFKVLVDKEFINGKIDTTATQAIAISPAVWKFKKYKYLKHETLYNGVGATVGSIATGAIWMVLISNQAAGVAATTRLSTRIRFEDA